MLFWIGLRQYSKIFHKILCIAAADTADGFQDVNGHGHFHAATGDHGPCRQHVGCSMMPAA
jgi:hypothetical protein